MRPISWKEQRKVTIDQLLEAEHVCDNSRGHFLPDGDKLQAGNAKPIVPSASVSGTTLGLDSRTAEIH